MEEKNRFENIRISITIFNPAELKISVSGERVEDYKRYFTDIYFNKLIQLVPHGRWGIIFGQIDEHEPRFVTDIFTDDVNEYALILEGIKADLPKGITLDLRQYFWGFDQFLQMTKQQFPV